MGAAQVDPGVFRAFAIALALGLLIGLERERAGAAIAGIRTFALVTWLGSILALLTAQVGAWLLTAGLLAVAGLAGAGHVAKMGLRHQDPGITTEIALLVMYGVGASVVLAEPQVAIAVSGVVALLLHGKARLHALARHIPEDDVAAVMRFVLIALVVLPVLPDRPMGPYGVLNPWNIWLIVVLIVGIGLGGYAVYTLAGARLGPLIGGAVGGLISSTATTVSYARRAAAQPEQAPACACVIAVASAVVFARIAAIVAAAAPALLPALWGPLAIVGMAAALGALVLVRATQRNGDGAPRLGNPAELGPALAFAAIYTAVLIAVRFVREQFGETGVYGLAALAGLTDVDAIALSTARLSVEGQLAADLAWRAIVLSALANLLFKAGVVVALGPVQLRRWVATAFAPPLLAGAAVLLLWPHS